MGKDPGTGGTGVSQTQDAEEIREQIEATREELGDTVEALAAKTDVKAQAKRKLEETKAQVAGTKEEILGKAKEVSPDAAIAATASAGQKARENPLPVAVAGAFALGFLAGRLTKD
jgi:chromosome segregation ATPase